MTKKDIVDQLKKEGVSDIDGLADFLLKRAHPGGDMNKQIAKSVIICNHGFVTS